ncbi:MAG: DUF4402 domain-containing protein [Cetobacterium sp.]
MNITANIITPLNITHNGDINFGKVFQGSTHTSSRHGFIISGEPGQNIKVYLNGSNLNSSNESVTLNHISSDDKLNVQIVNISDYDKNTKLNKDGKFFYDFDAELKVREDSALGLYSGTLTMSVIFQ